MNYPSCDQNRESTSLVMGFTLLVTGSAILVTHFLRSRATVIAPPDGISDVSAKVR